MTDPLFEAKAVRISRGRKVFVFRHRAQAGEQVGEQILENDIDVVGIGIPISGSMPPASQHSWAAIQAVPQDKVRRWLKLCKFKDADIDNAWNELMKAFSEMAALK